MPRRNEYEGSEFTHLPDGADLLNLDEVYWASRLALFVNTRNDRLAKLDNGDLLDAQKEGIRREIEKTQNEILGVVRNVAQVKSSAGKAGGKDFKSFSFSQAGPNLRVVSDGFGELAHGVTHLIPFSDLPEDLQVKLTELTGGNEALDRGQSPDSPSH